MIMMKNNRAWTRLILTTTLAAGLVFGVGAAANAQRNWGPDCSRRLEADRARIDRDAARHGKDSPAVRHDVDRMQTDRQWCRDHKAEWDHNRFDTGIYLHL
jgi:hypothetical protein